jgi:hypothetical protein
MNLNQNIKAEINNTEVIENCTNVLAQTKAHNSRSEKYSVVSSKDLIDQLEEAGFTCQKVAEERNTQKYKGFGTHLIRCVHPEITMGNDILNRELTPQIYIKNSYHGRTRFEVHLGLFRTFCLNGLILGDKFKTIKLKHIGLSKDEVTELIADMSRIYKDEVAPFVLSLKETVLTQKEQEQFAKTMLQERMRSNINFISGEHLNLLTINRDEDKESTAWEVFQRVQENMGLNFGTKPVELVYQYNSKDKDGNAVIKDRKLSKLTNIKEVTYLNKLAFDMITEYLPANK